MGFTDATSALGAVAAQQMSSPRLLAIQSNGSSTDLEVTPSRNSKELITLNLVEEFTTVRIGFRIFTMKTVQSQMLEHRNQKGDLPREKSGGFGRWRNSAAKPEGRGIFNFKTTIENLNREQ